MNADSVCRSAWAKADWETIESDGNKLLSVFNNSQAPYFIRLGDGELNILRKRENFGHLLANAVDHCHLLGLPDHYNKLQHQWKAVIVSSLKTYDVCIDTKPVVSAIYPLFVPSIIGKIIRDKKVLWVTNNSATIIKNLNNAQYRDFYGIQQCQSEGIQIPPGRTLPYTKDNPIDTFNKICEEILLKDFDIAIIGAGVIGKLIAQFISQNMHKAALDAGCILSAFRGYGADRVIFQNELKGLVWLN